MPKERNIDINAVSLVNSCQRKGAGVLFRINYSIYQHTGVEPLTRFRTANRRRIDKKHN